MAAGAEGLRPCARQVPKIDARVILVSVPWLGACATADFAADHQVAQAAFGGVVVRWHLGLGHEDEEFLEEFLDVVLHASAQPGLDGQRVIQEGTAEGQQAFFQDRLGGAALLLCGMGKGRGLGGRAGERRQPTGPAGGPGGRGHAGR